jgi:hypothetical protein
MPVSYPTTFLRSDSVFVDPLANNLIGPNGAPLPPALGGTGITNFSVPLPVALGGTGNSGTAWTAYTPTITAGAGTFTSVSATGRFKTIGKTVFIQIDIAITSNGTAASDVLATLPVAAFSNAVLVGRAANVSGKILQGLLNGSQAAIVNYDNSYPGATGEALHLSGVYESV